MIEGNYSKYNLINLHVHMLEISQVCHFDRVWRHNHGFTYAISNKIIISYNNWTAIYNEVWIHHSTLKAQPPDTASVCGELSFTWNYYCMKSIRKDPHVVCFHPALFFHNHHDLPWLLQGNGFQFNSRSSTKVQGGSNKVSDST